MRKFTTLYVKDFDATPVERNLVILLDGTWNDETGKDGDGVVTNIVKLFRVLEPDSSKQIRRYFRGVGNDEDYGAFDRFRGGAFGRKEKMIRDHAYATIAKEFHPGDRIFIFGFSRGAASARMLANDLNEKGIPERISVTREPVANRFTKNIEYRFIKYEAEGATKDVDVEFLGVWDTVAAFGNPLNRWDPFKNMTIAPNIRRAVHLVSLDETRTPFQPTLMNHNPGVVHEVWFAGVHSDIGGGYKKDELGQLTLGYMLAQADAYCDDQGRQRMFRDDTTEKSLTECNLDRPVHFHFHGLPSGLKRLTGQHAIRDVTIIENDEPADNLHPKIHNSVMQLQRSAEVFSLVKKKNLFRDDEEYRTRIIYNPPALKFIKAEFNMI